MADRADRITIEIELGNAAMQSPAEVVGAIETAIRRQTRVWDDGPLEPGDEGPIRDENGNTVGSWIVR